MGRVRIAVPVPAGARPWQSRSWLSGHKTAPNHPCRGSAPFLSFPFPSLLPSAQLSPCPGGHEVWLKPSRVGLSCSIPAGSCLDTARGGTAPGFLQEKERKHLVPFGSSPWHQLLLHPPLPSSGNGILAQEDSKEESLQGAAVGRTQSQGPALPFPGDGTWPWSPELSPTLP